MIWVGGWSWYFPFAGFNPFSYPIGEGGLPPSVNGFLTLSGNLFFLNQPIWKMWFAGTGAFTFALAIFLFIKNKNTQDSHEQVLLQKLRRAEKTALCAKMNPHFIFNVLNSIQGFIIDGDRASSARYLAKFSKLVRAALDHSEAGKIPLHEELAFLKSYIELEQLRFKGRFDFEMEVHPDIDPSLIHISPMLLQPYIENAILHGLAPKKRKGLLQVNISPDENGILVKITDNGIGITASQKMKKNRIGQHVSLGMSITEQRLGLLAKQKTKQQVEIKELVDTEGTVAATEVVVRIGYTT